MDTNRPEPVQQGEPIPGDGLLQEGNPVQQGEPVQPSELIQHDEPMRYGGSAGHGGSVSHWRGGPLRNDGEVASIVAQARSRSDGFHYGDDRAIGARPNWAAHESEQLYRYATVNNDPSSAQEIGQGWAKHSAQLQQAADDLYNAISELGTAWIGQAAGEAQGWLVGIANAGSEAASATEVMSKRLAQQSAAAAELKAMPPPQEFDPAAETAAMLAGGPAAMTGDLKAKFDAAQEVKAQQIACLNAYTTAMSEVDDTTPSFGPESLGLKPAPAGTDPGIDRISQVGPTIPSGGGPGAALAGFSASPAIAPQGAGGMPVPGASGAPAPGTPTPAPMAAAQGAGSVQVSPESGGGAGVGSSLGAGAAGGALGFAGARAISGRSSGASGKRGESRSESQSVDQKQGSQTAASADHQITGSASLAGAGHGPTPVAPSGAPNPGQVSPPAGAPIGGMGGMGAGAAGRTVENEQEHTHASFLIEPDPDDTFGAAGVAAPPVLGAWSPDDEER